MPSRLNDMSVYIVVAIIYTLALIPHICYEKMLAII